MTNNTKNIINPINAHELLFFLGNNQSKFCIITLYKINNYQLLEPHHPPHHPRENHQNENDDPLENQLLLSYVERDSLSLALLNSWVLIIVLTILDIESISLISQSYHIGLISNSLKIGVILFINSVSNQNATA